MMNFERSFHVIQFAEYEIEDIGEFSHKLQLLNSYVEQEMVTWQNEQGSYSNHHHPYGLYCK